MPKHKAPALGPEFPDDAQIAKMRKRGRGRDGALPEREVPSYC